MVRGLLGVATAPAGATPVWVIRTNTESFFSAAGARFFSTATISLWLTTAVWVLAVPDEPAAALETSANRTLVATRKRRNMREGYDGCPGVCVARLWSRPRKEKCLLRGGVPERRA